MILCLAFSFETPISMYERCLPSSSLILDDVTGGPLGVPQILGGGGRVALYDHANTPTNSTTNSFETIPDTLK